MELGVVGQGRGRGGVGRAVSCLLSFRSVTTIHWQMSLFPSGQALLDYTVQSFSGPIVWSGKDER